MKRFTHVSKLGLLLLFSFLRVGCIYGQAPKTGPDWLSDAQKKPVPGQVRIFYNACTDEQAFVSNNTRKWAQSAVRVGQHVTLQLIGVNPFYKQTIKFDKASFSWKTPEPENFQLTTIPVSASKGDDTSQEVKSTGVGNNKFMKGSHNEKTQEVTGARGVVKNQINALKALKVTTKNKAVTRNDIVILNQLLSEAELIENETAGSHKDLVVAESQVADAFTVLESIVGFQTSLTILPCLTLDDYTRQETTLLNSLAEYLGDNTVTNNAGKLANAFRHKIEAYPITYDFVESKHNRLQTDVANLEAQIEGSLTDESKTAAQALVDEMKSTLKLFSDVLDSKQSAVSTLRDQLAGEEGRKLSRTCQTLLNNKTYFNRPFVLGPFNPDRNANEISIKATAKRPAADGKGELTDEPLIDLTLPVIKNIQIDFTTGGLFSSLADDAFVVRTTPSSTTATPDTYSIQTNKNRGGFVVATQANLIWQTSPSFGWGANIGIGVDLLNDQRARYMMGLSSKFGGLSDNLILSAGVVFGKVKRLSAEVSPDITYQKEVDPKTYDKFDTGFYVGVSYVLGSKKIKK